jgi:5-methyltetrahydrofolate--homocysteine methyltransferase
MIIIGERINSTRKAVRQAIADKDVAFLQKLAADQVQAGADYIDVNAGAFPEQEIELLPWLVQVVQEVVPASLCLDSANPQALQAALEVNKNNSTIINSITGERSKFERIVQLARKYGAAVVALAIDDSGITKTAEDRFRAACGLIKDLRNESIPPNDIYLDPLIQPVSVQNDFGVIALEVLRRVKCEFPEVRTTCGLSNVSFGLPRRADLNSCFLTMAMAAGLDSAILDCLDKQLMADIKTAEALLGKDRFCKNYIKAFRQAAGPK